MWPIFSHQRNKYKLVRGDFFRWVTGAFLFIASIWLFTTACTPKTLVNSDDDPGVSYNLYGGNLKKVFYQSDLFYVNVFYEPEAKPFVGDTGKGINYWQLLENNLRAVFKQRTRQINVFVPYTYAQMNPIGKQDIIGWRQEDILKLADKLPTKDDDKTSELKVLFVKGFYMNPKGQIKRDIIGINMTGRMLVVIFKDVVNAVDAEPGSHVKEFVEQATIIHESGHALGLVNQFIKSITDHHDYENPGHCSDPNCVMYHLNSGEKDLKEFVKKVLKTKDENNEYDYTMFGPACLQDIRDYR